MHAGLHPDLGRRSLSALEAAHIWPREFECNQCCRSYWALDPLLSVDFGMAAVGDLQRNSDGDVQGALSSSVHLHLCYAVMATNMCVMLPTGCDHYDCFQ